MVRPPDPALVKGRAPLGKLQTPLRGERQSSRCDTEKREGSSGGRGVTERPR